MTIPENVSILEVERPFAVNRYGERRREMIYNRIGGWLKLSTSYERDASGGVTQIAGKLVLEGTRELKVDDVLTLDNPDRDQYTVFQVEEGVDTLGLVQVRTYRLVKVQRQS